MHYTAITTVSPVCNESKSNNSDNYKRERGKYKVEKQHDHPPYVRDDEDVKLWKEIIIFDIVKFGSSERTHVRKRIIAIYCR
ncbi:hypothetical protein T4D_5146 [Trichinella pseudospiralis]|uniref:Uncharacterized protein n=1 Tax=Trichinella pseudospiralis TaxID=6337 RepID=A0A0V1FG81_TRIPS|nr:hypothetical protein T4D_5146 [Trichinella pseudospiralis]